MRQNVNETKYNVRSKYYYTKCYIDFVIYSPFSIEHTMETRDIVLFRLVFFNGLNSTGTAGWQGNV